jgi:glutamyl-tRNA synthetase
MIRVRWAPSNTGSDVHVGNVRTVLFNYLFAKKMGGVSVFRIEDSDIARSKEEYADNIANTLNWLGLKADEGYKIGGDLGPYQQTHKLKRYSQVADELIERGLAYRCYCTADNLNKLRQALPENKRDTFRYPGICRDRKDWPENQDYVIRLKAPTEGSVSWDDITFGRIEIPNVENYDWVLMRCNGIPLYNFGCVIDDYDQKITHIIRGRDHIGNTNCQIILHQMMGSQPIKFAHLPMMLGPDGSKLSKRHGAATISAFRDMGYTPGAILNYLLRFGFGFGNQEIFSMEEMLDKFTLEACGKNDGRFDVKKFAAIQYQHLKSTDLTSDDKYAEYLMSSLKSNLSFEKVKSLIPLVRTRSKTLVEAVNELEPIHKDFSLDKDISNKVLTNDAKDKLSKFCSVLNNIEDWSEDNLRTKTQEWLASLNFTIKDIGQPARVSIFGRTNSPELFQVMSALGKSTTINRISRAIG